MFIRVIFEPNNKWSTFNHFRLTTSDHFLSLAYTHRHQRSAILMLDKGVSGFFYLDGGVSLPALVSHIGIVHSVAKALWFWLTSFNLIAIFPMPTVARGLWSTPGCVGYPSTMHCYFLHIKSKSPLTEFQVGMDDSANS